MRRKGRVSAGSDADIVVFDPETITDQATYTDSTRPSSGIRHVLVNGAFVVRDGELDAGRPAGAAGPGLTDGSLPDLGGIGFDLLLTRLRPRR